jgi:ABC-type transport system involved in multi-copper enzyme maturation permease subunit
MAGREARKPGFQNVLAAEWVKFTSLRSTWITLGLGVALAIAMTVMMSTAIGGSWDPENKMYAEFNPITWSMDATLIATIAFSVLGVSVAAGEYTSGMIRLSLMATPRRGSILAAKAIIVAGATAVAGLLSVAVMFLAAQAIYGSYDMPTASLSDPEAVRLVLGMGGLAAAFPVLGLALGFILRSTVAGITSILALSFVPDFLGGLFPAWWQENIISFLPSQAIRALTVGTVVDSPRYQEPVVAAVALAAWVAVALAGAYVVLKRRDA